MADVEIIIGPEDKPLNVMRGTGVEEERETNTDTTTCFDEVIQEGSKNTGFTVSIDKLGYDSMQDYIDLDEELEKMVYKPGTITIREVIRFKDDDPYLLKRVYHEAILADDKYKMEPEKKAVKNLKFNCGSRTKEAPVLYTGDD